MNTEPEPIGAQESLQRIYDRFGPKNSRVPATGAEQQRRIADERKPTVTTQALPRSDADETGGLTAGETANPSGLELRLPEFDPSLYEDLPVPVLAEPLPQNGDGEARESTATRKSPMTTSLGGQNPFSDSVRITVIRDQHTRLPIKVRPLDTSEDDIPDTAICVEVEVEVKEFHRGTNPHAFDPQKYDPHEVVLGEARVSEDAIGYELRLMNWSESGFTDISFVAFRKGEPIELTKGELSAAEEKAIEEAG